MRSLIFYIMFFASGFAWGAMPSASIGDVFMFRKDCASASQQYKMELEKSFNPYVASNLAVSLYCLDNKKEA